MSSKPGNNFWSFKLHRFRTLLQLIHNSDTSAVVGGGRRPSPPSKPSAGEMVPYRWDNNNNKQYYSIRQMFRSVGSTTFMSSLRSYFPRIKWVFGSILSLLIPTWKKSWNKFQTLEEEAEEVIEEAEIIAEAVEKVAELTEKISAEIGEKLPEKSKFKEAAHVVQNYSKEIANDAHLTQDILHKVEEWKQKLDKSETVVIEQKKAYQISENE